MFSFVFSPFENKFTIVSFVFLSPLVGSVLHFIQNFFTIYELHTHDNTENTNIFNESIIDDKGEKLYMNIIHLLSSFEQKQRKKIYI